MPTLLMLSVADSIVPGMVIATFFLREHASPKYRSSGIRIRAET